MRLVLVGSLSSVTEGVGVGVFERSRRGVGADAAAIVWDRTLKREGNRRERG